MKQLPMHCALMAGVLFLSHNSFAEHTLLKDEMISKPYNWTGFYVGGNLGAVKHSMDVTDNQAVTFNATINQTANPGFIGGFQLGIRHQIDPAKTSGVYGLEYSANFSNSRFNKIYGSPFALYQLYSEYELRNSQMAQLIAGIAADQMYLFLAAGFSWTDISGSITNMDGIPFFTSLSLSKKSLGTALGAGIEYGLTERISMRFKVDVVSAKVFTAFDSAGDSYQVANNLVQGSFGVNYKFA